MITTGRYSPEVKERAVRMVLEHEREYDPQWAAIVSIAEKIGCCPETLRKWVRRVERTASFGGRTRSCARRLRFSPRRSSTADRDDDIIH